VAGSGAGALMLVVGSHGSSGFAALTLGSVSRYAAVHAPCPVVVVREAPADSPRRVVVGVRSPQDCAAALAAAYDELAKLEKSGTSLKDGIGPMVYGMDVNREAHHDSQIVFLPTGSGGDPAFHEAAHRKAKAATGLDLAELK